MGQLTMEFYLKRLKSRYMRGNRKVKSAILDEYCKTSGCHRKHATRLLTRTSIGWRDKPAGRKKAYKPEDLLEPLKQLWFATDQLCGRRLKVAIPLWMPYYEALYGALELGIKQQLLSASSATLDRLLKPCRGRYPKRLSGTRPGSLLRQQIPIKTNQWNEDRPGFVEADTVAHCGMSLAGNFVWSITLTDIYSGWTENRATWNKGSHGVFAQLESIEKDLPFIILGFDSDNGGEFLNFHLMKYFLERDQPVQFTRSRPYHSGDNAHVEQKNWTHVRQLFGYYRFENIKLVDLMNDVYQNECSLLHNYFYPSMKLQDKVRIQSKIKKKYDAPMTPFQRLMGSEHVTDLQKEKLQNTMNSLNPFDLKKSLELKLKKIFSLIKLSLKRTGT
jgi:hypothetical protein